MRSLIFLLGVSLGCGSAASTTSTQPKPVAKDAPSEPASAPSEPASGTPTGMVAVEDLRRHLGPAVASKAPADDAATKHALDVDLHGVKAKVVWRVFQDGPNKYLLSVGLEVVTPSPGVNVKKYPAMNPTNGGTTDAVIEQLPLKLKWSTFEPGGLRMGEISVRIRADGTGEKL